jgi:uncharacterized radical SAM superfamily Fe-S cluster-containing enzyme
MENTTITSKYPSINPKNTVKGRYFTDDEIITAKDKENPQMLNVSLYLGKQCNIDCIDCFTKAKEESSKKLPTSQLDILLGKRLSLEEYYHCIDECKRL